MLPLSSFFDNYRKNFAPPQSGVVEEVREVVKDLLGMELKKEQVSYSVLSKTISLQCGAVLKHEIVRHKDDILLHLKARLGEKHCPTNLR